jgi:hypothetical protein
MRVSRGATLILSIPQWGVETYCCLLTGATVGACRAGSRVDFASTGCCVALSRSSLLPGKRYLSRSIPVYVLITDYQWFSYLSIENFTKSRIVARFLSPPTGLEVRPDNAAPQLLDRHSDNAAAHLADAQSECKECATAQSGRNEAAKRKG